MEQGQESFAYRFGLRPKSPSLIYDDLPLQVRIGIYNVFDIGINKFSNFNTWIELYKRFCLRQRKLIQPGSAEDARRSLREGIIGSAWYEVMGICEEAYQIFEGLQTGFGDDLVQQLSRLFNEERIGYRLQKGIFEKVSEPHIQERIEQAKMILSAPDFSGPAQEFEKAIGFWGHRPEPDYPNCIKEAVGAVEAVARIIEGKPNLVLSDLIPKMATKGLIPKPLDTALEKIYAYRGAAEGVAHGQTAPESPVGAEEAELILGLCASWIVYLAKKWEKVRK